MNLTIHFHVSSHISYHKITSSCCFHASKEKNGFTNNPHIQQFKSALKSILLRTAVVGSKHCNCATFEADESSAIFSLKWSKNLTPITKEKDDGDGYPVPPVLPNLSKISIKYISYVILGFLFHENDLS